MLSIVNKHGQSCPMIFCDYCQEPIEGSGNYQFLMSSDQRTPLYFTHKRCCDAFERAHPAPEGVCWGASELDTLLVYLGNTLKVDWEKARERARLFATA